MAKFMAVDATITDLGVAKKGRFAGKQRRDVLVLKPAQEFGMEVDASLVPEYAQNMLASGKKVVMYKTNKAYTALVEALFPVQDAMEVASTPEPSIEDVMAEAEARNAKMDAIRRSNLPKEVKAELLASI